MIQINDLTKTFEQQTVLHNINLQIKPGSIFGLVGPNGAGKTTLIKTMMGIYLPTRGKVFVNGRDVHREPEFKQAIGYVSDFQSFYPQFKVKDMVRLYRESYRSWQEERFKELSAVFRLPEEQKVRNLSKGMKTQLAMLLNLSISPKLLVLDEPTSGLDPVLRRVVLNILMEEVADNQTTVFMSTHNLNELERICDHIGFLHQGQLVFEESLDNMKANIRKIQVAFRDEIPKEMLDHPDILKVEGQGRVYSIVVRENIDGVMAELRHYQPLLLETIDMTLEDIFIYRMGGVGYEFEQMAAQ